MRSSVEISSKAALSFAPKLSPRSPSQGPQLPDAYFLTSSSSVPSDFPTTSLHSIHDNYSDRTPANKSASPARHLHPTSSFPYTQKVAVLRLPCKSPNIRTRTSVIHIVAMFSRTISTTARRALTSATARPAARHLLNPAATVAVRRSYHEKVLDHYSRPRNVGSMNKADTDVGTGLVGAPACGDVMKLQIRVDPNSNTISDVKFKTFGCGSAIASSSYLTELVRGMTLEEAGRVKNTEIAKELCLPPVKRK